MIVTGEATKIDSPETASKLAKARLMVPRVLPAPAFLTTAEAAAYCGLSPDGLRKARARGLVHGALRGGRGRLMFSIEDLKKFMQGGSSDGAVETPLGIRSVGRGREGGDLTASARAATSYAAG